MKSFWNTYTVDGSITVTFVQLTLFMITKIVSPLLPMLCPVMLISVPPNSGPVEGYTCQLQKVGNNISDFTLMDQ